MTDKAASPVPRDEHDRYHAGIADHPDCEHCTADLDRFTASDNTDGRFSEIQVEEAVFPWLRKRE